MQHTTLETLPVELLAEIFSELDLESLIKVSYLSRRLRAVTSDTSLNPWRRPIFRILHDFDGVYEKCLHHLSVRSTVPRQNWIEILTFAPPSFLLFESSLPNLKSSEWEECFRRRFLPGWARWKKDCSWREAFTKMLYRVWHRSRSSCTSDESWTRYIVLNRSGSANELESSSRTFNPLVIFHEMKLQNNLVHLPTQIRVVLELIDVRIIVLGVLNRPRTSLTVNANAETFLHPPGLGPASSHVAPNGVDDTEGHSTSSVSGYPRACLRFASVYDPLTRPMPSPSHNNYPMYTPGGGDQRWYPGVQEEEGMQWVGGLMIAAQLHAPGARELGTARGLPELDLMDDIGHSQFASFTWQDFLAIAPWMEERVTKFIHGQGLGIH
ncbi:hypothetical protein HYDPIDRAFT_104624 [Hydnomerulius pinastri MD-312]|nr:hypothetical protein HYDPIDRAFT_104624 [Hydnomerulius pinastri MD-312]